MIQVPLALSTSEIRAVVRATLSTLHKIKGVKAYLVGGVACQIYGTSRVPNDIDVVVLTKHLTQEEIKHELVAKDSRFYLVAAKTPGATYKVLWFTLSEGVYRRRTCKVDILLTGTLDIPPVPPERFIYRVPSDIPVMPFIPLLLLKLQAWDHHRQALMQHLRQKQYFDVRDIVQLIQIGAGMGVSVAKETWLPASFIQTARRRVDSFVRMFPDTDHYWRKLGFEVEKPKPGIGPIRAVSTAYLSSLSTVEDWIRMM